ncbi:hypothetical protein KL86APRO_40077 [uncultured Alphaproteobacteria bacterium]|uniref:Uncharacterized protein n=1 Tax=uncultured Alphaproteobacteria bacterium TaxID=91750 RepID=A0A212KN64_9PROT|nr:hypothetical protein KL86APRO_40077 [uncultured Alphaproteobacteria bacterium]
MPAAVTPAELRHALADLAMRSASFARGRGKGQARAQLLVALSLANAYLGAADAPAAEIRDPEAWVESYLAAGGDWQRLVAAVNHAALDGATRRVS